MDLPAEFRRIALERAREKDHPEGAAAIGYSLTAPLDADGRLDPEIYHKHKEACRVWRYRGHEGDWGQLRRRPGGGWAFHYEQDGREDDDPAYRLGVHRFVVGEYVTFQEDDGAHTYRVVSVERV